MSCILEGLVMVYRVLGSTMRNQSSTGYLAIQLFSSQLLGLCSDYGATPVILLCGAVVFSYLGLLVCLGLAPGSLDRGASMYGTLLRYMHYIGRQLLQR